MNIQEEKPNYYSITPPNVRYDNSLSSTAKLLYGEISALTHKEGYCFATNTYFATLYNISERQISKIISQLAKKKYIHIDTVENKRKIYICDTRAKKTSIDIEQNFHAEVEQKFHHNNININNINNNGVDINTDTFIDGLITTYFNLYSEHYNRHHPQLTEDAESHVKQKIHSLMDEYGLEIVLDLWEDMVLAFFDNVKTDGNIKHFTEKNILKHRYYEAGGSSYY